MEGAAPRPKARKRSKIVMISGEWNEEREREAPRRGRAARTAWSHGTAQYSVDDGGF
jgi:hypothetical protein